MSTTYQAANLIVKRTLSAAAGQVVPNRDLQPSDYFLSIVAAYIKEFMKQVHSLLFDAKE